MRLDFNFLRHLLLYSLLGAFFFTLASLCHVRSSYGQEAAISDFTVSNSEIHLLVYMAITGWFSEDMEAAIHNGIPITFAFSIDLFAKRTNWPDKKILEYEFNHTLEYDSLKEEYLVQRNEKGDSDVTASLEEAKKLISEINGFKMVRLDELTPQTIYKLRAKARLARKSLPLYFHYLIPFSSPWDFETEWHELTLRFAL
jgi:hypothetical protein